MKVYDTKTAAARVAASYRVEITRRNLGLLVREATELQALRMHGPKSKVEAAYRAADKALARITKALTRADRFSASLRPPDPEWLSQFIGSLAREGMPGLLLATDMALMVADETGEHVVVEGASRRKLQMSQTMEHKESSELFSSLFEGITKAADLYAKAPRRAMWSEAQRKVCTAVLMRIAVVCNEYILGNEHYMIKEVMDMLGNVDYTILRPGIEMAQDITDSMSLSSSDPTVASVLDIWEKIGEARLAKLRYYQLVEQIAERGYTGAEQQEDPEATAEAMAEIARKGT